MLHDDEISIVAQHMLLEVGAPELIAHFSDPDFDAAVMNVLEMLTEEVCVSKILGLSVVIAAKNEIFQIQNFWKDSLALCCDQKK